MSVSENVNITDPKLSFRAGDVIQNYCDPFIKILLSSQKGTRCDECFKTDNSGNSSLHRCSGCKLMFYCGKKCQTRDWTNAHKLECKSSFFRQTPTDSSHFTSDTLQFKYRIFRLIASLKLRPDMAEKKVTVYDGSKRCFDDLMSHEEQLGRDKLIIDLCTEIYTQLKTEGSKLTMKDGVGVDYLIRLSGIFRTNAFCIYTEGKTEGIGSGLFIQTSVFDHSCKPTALFVISADSRMQIRAIADIPKGQAPMVSYLLAHKGRGERRRILQCRYNFDCRCERCEQELQAELRGSGYVDYERLNELQRIGAESVDWRILLDTHYEMIPILRTIYYEYDERITNQFHWVCTRGVELGVARSELTDLVIEAENHLLVTFGPDHHDYKKFNKLFSSSPSAFKN